MDEVNLSSTWQIETNRMLFIELKASMQVIKFNSKLTKLIKASHMSFMDENKLRVIMHSSDRINSNLNKLIKAS